VRLRCTILLLLSRSSAVGKTLLLARLSSAISFGLVLLLFSAGISPGQIPNGTLHRRLSRASNFEFALYNNGMLIGDDDLLSGGVFAPPLAHWPRGSNHMLGWGLWNGLTLCAKKNGRYLSSDAGVWKGAVPAHGPFNQTVPGRIGDTRAGYDSVYHGAGWRYVDDPDYIVYSSLDYDAFGVDTSGSNYNDWPLRWVNGESKYIADPLERQSYPPCYTSDEDLFCVFKDTDTRADRMYTGPGGASEPIGIEVEHTVFSWGNGPAKDMVVFQYDFINKSGELLESCYVSFGSALALTGGGVGTFRGIIPHVLQTYPRETSPDLVYMVPRAGEDHHLWTATPYPPTIGYAFLESPFGYGGIPTGIAHGVNLYMIEEYCNPPPDSIVHSIMHEGVDSSIYFGISDPHWGLCVDTLYANVQPYPVLTSGAFRMLPGERTRLSVALTFSDSLGHLLLLDELLKRIHAHGYQRPSPPASPHLTAAGLNHAVKLTWDRRAEETPDVIVPDSLGRPFAGYRLLRSVTERGPYTELARWSVDSLIVHEYIDRGEGIGGLKNNVRYYYQLLAFDEGAPRIKLEPMETKPEQGVNWVSATPGASASDLTTSSGNGALISGTLGNISTPQLVPSDNTNFANLFSGKSIELNVTAATDGIRYTLPVTVRDTISGREQFAVLDPGLFVGGTPAIAGVKEGVLHIADVFGLGGARIDLPYRFEQTDDTLALAEPVIESPTGADVPVLVKDSMRTTGIQTLTPYIESGRELVIEFLPGGIDTISLIFGFILPYRNIRITDGATGEELEPGVDWTMRMYVTRAQGGPQGNSVRNRYYLSGLAPNGFELHAGHLLTINNSVVVFDYPDRGRGSGKPSPTFPWGSGHRAGTRDIQVGDRVRIGWDGGVRGLFPRDAVLTLTGPAPGQTDVTENMLEKVRIVPNPYMIRHEAQRGAPRIYFNYLPEECTITIYTVALDRIATLQHRGGSREEWNLMTERGQLVASQLLFASIEAPNGKRVTKKFAVILGR
jgi:hypothetical protein